MKSSEINHHVIVMKKTTSEITHEFETLKSHI